MFVYPLLSYPNNDKIIILEGHDFNLKKKSNYFNIWVAAFYLKTVGLCLSTTILAIYEVEIKHVQFIYLTIGL